MLWLTPIYKSPLQDQGYDISDHKSINPIFGTMKDWENLCEEIHKRGIKLMMDMVLDHTSAQVWNSSFCLELILFLIVVKHEWSLKSKRSRDSPKRDWYFWRKGQIGQHGESLPPNNWMSLFGNMLCCI